MAIDFKALAAKAVEAGGDQSVAKKGGGDREVAAAGPGLCRFVAYIETGKQVKKFQGKDTVYEEVILVFELVGKRHPPTVLEDGTVLPHRVTVREKLSLNEKANFFKLFNRLNYKQTAKHLAELLGEGFKCEVVHDKWTGRDGKERVDITLRNEAGYTLAPPRKEDEDSETGWVDVAVPPATSDLRLFLWQHADLDQWASLYIEGEYPERKDDKGNVTAPARSKNTFQNRIVGAKNFEGSVIHELLVSNGTKLDFKKIAAELAEEDDQAAAPAEAEQAPPAQQATAPAADALGGIV